MRILPTLIAVWTLGVLSAQSLHPLRQCIGCGAGTGHYSSQPLYVSSSLGQAQNLGSHSQAGLTMRQGFQQAPSASLLWFSATVETIWNVFPNPCYDHLDLVASLESAEGWTAVLRDGQGREVARWFLGAAREHRLDLRALPTGPYLLELRSNTRSSTYKIIRL